MADTPDNFKTRLEESGLSIAEWARTNGFNVRTVYAVLRGEIKAKRGIGHKIAVAAGIKKQPLKAA
jgi:gp16 family phage-associated protein